MPTSFAPNTPGIGNIYAPGNNGTVDTANAWRGNTAGNVVTPGVIPRPVSAPNAPPVASQSPTSPPVTTPVVTSKTAQDDYNAKYADYQDKAAALEQQTNAQLAAKQQKELNDSQTALKASETNLAQQGIDIKKAEVDAKNKALGIVTTPDNTPSPTTASSTPTITAQPATPTPVENANTNITNENTTNTNAQNDILNQKTAVYNTFQQQVSQLMSGTFPLSTTEQALVNSVQSSLDRQKASITGVLAEEAARGGQEYTPGQMASNMINKVMDLDALAAGTMASLKLGFEKQDYAMINDTYDKQTKYLDDKSATIQKLHDQVLATEKDQRDQVQKAQDTINTIATDAAKNGADATTIAKITGSKSLGEAISNAGDMLQNATGTLGDYLQYKRDALAKGLTPSDYTTYRDQQDAKAEKAKIKEAYATQSAKNSADANSTASDKTQQKLEQQYRQVLSKEFASRTGSLGIENAKVNQANHLNSLVTQYYDPKTGDYNVPKAQYSELVMGLANMISPTGTADVATRKDLNAFTAKSDLNGALQYLTGSPQNGNTQEMIKNIVDSVDRQAETATRNREAALQNMRDQAPTDLDSKRIDSLNKSTQMVKYEGQSRISKNNVDNYIKSNPKEADNIAKLYEVPGATDEDIEAYLKANGKI